MSSNQRGQPANGVGAGTCQTGVDGLPRDSSFSSLGHLAGAALAKKVYHVSEREEAQILRVKLL